MAQLPGYRIALETREINTILTESGYVHCLAGPQHAPLDSELFSYRKKNNAINVPSIAIASLLAKKLVARITVAGLDIRVSTYNNFGKTWAEARINAQCYCRVASILNIKPICFLTNGSVPYQPFIGRGESLAALWEILNQQPSGALTKHQMLCKRMSLAVLNVQPSMANKNTTLKEVFEQNLNSQGSSYTSFVDRVETVLKGHTNTIRSEADGFLSIDLERIRCVIVAAQIKNGETRNTFPDACGLILKHIPGDYVRKDEVLATVRVEPEGQLESVKAEISPALTVVKEHNFHEDQYEEVKLA
jgi:pyrimidine-nucleoside phosphorylase